MLDPPAAAHFFVFPVVLAGIRVSKQQELAGMDDSKHGGQTFPELLPRRRTMDRPGSSFG